jgi:succinate dehydrogenase/fumarate reductase flavoprotein subunit
VANEIRTVMQQHAAVFRKQASMDEGVGKIAAVRERVKAIGAEGQVARCSTPPASKRWKSTT